MHPNEDRSRLLTNGVTVTPNDGLWLGEARGLVLFHSVSTSTFSFSETVNVDFGISTRQGGGSVFRYSENVEPYWEYPDM